MILQHLVLDDVVETDKPVDDIGLSMKILITGGCGFIGTNLICKILKEQPEADIQVLG